MKQIGVESGHMLINNIDNKQIDINIQRRTKYGSPLVFSKY